MGVYAISPYDGYIPYDGCICQCTIWTMGICHQWCIYIYMICIYIYIHYMDVSEHRVYLQKQSEFNRGIGWTWWFFTIFGVIHFQTSDIAIMVCGCLKWGIRPEWTLNLGQHGQTGMVWTPVGNTLNWPHKVGVSRIEWGATIQKVRVTKK